MNKKNYMNSIDNLDISQDFNVKTAARMKSTLNTPSKMNFSRIKLVYSLASLALFVTVSTYTWNKFHNDNNANENKTSIDITSESENEIASLPENSGITIPETTLPNTDGTAISSKMMALFIYKGRTYLQSNTALQVNEMFQINKEDAINIRGDYLGKTTGNLDEWSNQSDYATEFASTIGESDIYTIKGYDSQYRLMVWNEYTDGFSAQVFDSFGGLYLTSGSDYFTILNLKNNVVSLQWENYDSWNNGKKELVDLTMDSRLDDFMESLYSSTPLGDMSHLFTENTNPDSQKLIYLKTHDNLITSLHLFKDGYVYAAGAGFFQVESTAFRSFWDTMPLNKDFGESNDTSTDPATQQSLIDVSLVPSSYQVGTANLTLIIKNNSTQDIFYGVDYKMEQKSGDNWIAVPAVDELMFIEIAHLLASGSEQAFEVNLDQLNPRLEAGTYRIMKQISNEAFCLEFELTN